MPIYLDYMATTPVDERVRDVMIKYLTIDGIFANPSSNTHIYGQIAARAVEKAREQIALTINADAREIYFTSGATEANNIALLGAIRFYQRKGKHIITLSTEHKSVLEPLKQLSKEGFDITYLKPQNDGLLDIHALRSALREDTICVSIMHVNNEIGVIQDIQAIGELLKNRGIIFHVDAAQSAGKLSIDVKKFAVHLMSFSSHKNYGPKGIGALYISERPKIRLSPITFGGGQENGVRPGTLATHQIAAMGEAFFLAERDRTDEQARILALREKLWHGIKHLPGIQLNGNLQQRVAGNLNFSFSGIDATELLPALSELALSTSSACNAALSQPSYVLEAIGVSKELANSSIRLAVGRYTTEKEVNKVIEIICQQITMLYELS